MGMRLNLPIIGRGMPLLGKELVEQANQRRTYVIRLVYAGLLFLGSAFALGNAIQYAQGDPFQLMGSGKTLVETLLVYQFIGIYLFLPGMVAATIAGEKEQSAFELLVLTDLRPWEILFEKLAGRLLPMFSFILLSLPIMAVAYSLGGITSDRIIVGVYGLLLACLQVGTLSLACSAFCSSTRQAFGLIYVVGLVIHLVPIFAAVLAHEWFGASRRDMNDFIEFWGWLFPPVFVFDRPYGDAWARSIPAWISVVIYIGLARFFVLRYALRSPSLSPAVVYSKLGELFGGRRPAPGKARSSGSLPRDKPIAWRETATGALGRPRYLVASIIVTVIVSGVIIAGMATIDRHSSQAEGVSIAVFLFWPVAVLRICVSATNAFASERARQTLEVLLTTPLTGREIVIQKTAGTRRAMYLMWIPFCMAFLVEFAWEWGRPEIAFYFGGSSYDPAESIVYLCSSLLSLLIYMPMFLWFSTWVGLKIRSRTRATLTAMAGILAWCAAPLLFLTFIDSLFLHHALLRDAPNYLMLSSPATIVAVTEVYMLDEVGGPSFLPVLLNYGFYFACALFFRYLCLHDADANLGRLKG